MKKDIHPELHEITAHCACGTTFNTRSTLDDIKLTICSGCHPFYTGEQKFVDTAGRVERFQKRYDAANKPAPKAPAETKSKKSSKKA